MHLQPRKDPTRLAKSQRHRFEQAVAEVIVKEGLRRYEVLSDTPSPPGSDLFSRAAYGGGDGSSPMIEEPGE